MAYVLKHDTIEVSEAVSIPAGTLLGAHGAVWFRLLDLLVCIAKLTGFAASEASRNCSAVIVLRRRFDPPAADSSTAKSSNRFAIIDGAICKPAEV
jgi:hypothetical protein